METQKTGDKQGRRYTEMETHRDGDIQKVIVVYPELLEPAAFLTCVMAPESCYAPPAMQALPVALGFWGCSIAEYPGRSLLR